MKMQEHFDRMHGYLFEVVGNLETDGEKSKKAKEHLFEIIRNYNAILRLADLPVKHHITFPDEEEDDKKDLTTELSPV